MERSRYVAAGIGLLLLTVSAFAAGYLYKGATTGEGIAAQVLSGGHIRDATEQFALARALDRGECDYVRTYLRTQLYSNILALSHLYEVAPTSRERHSIEQLAKKIAAYQATHPFTYPDEALNTRIQNFLRDMADK